MCEDVYSFVVMPLSLFLLHPLVSNSSPPLINISIIRHLQKSSSCLPRKHWFAISDLVSGSQSTNSTNLNELLASTSARNNSYGGGVRSLADVGLDLSSDDDNSDDDDVMTCDQDEETQAEAALSHMKRSHAEVFKSIQDNRQNHGKPSLPWRGFGDNSYTNDG